MSAANDDMSRRVAVSGFTALPTGTRVDRYEIVRLIAAGGFGVTYVARHVVLEKLVALKEHFPRDFAQRDGVSLSLQPTNPETFSWTKERFIREGRTLTECRHPNVVEVTDVFEANGTAYMALGYVEGQSLSGWLKSLKRPPTQPELDAILKPLLDALEFVHARDLLHRDLAPDNIIIRDDGSPVLIDFGAARQAVAQRSMMMSAIVKGGYSPPEQYTSKGQTQGPWSDIYALGATLHYLVTGQAVEESTARTAEDGYRPVAETLGARASDYRPGFLAAIDQSLKLARLERPQSIAAMRSGLFGAPPSVAHIEAPKSMPQAVDPERNRATELVGDQVKKVEPSRAASANSHHVVDVTRGAPKARSPSGARYMIGAGAVVAAAFIGYQLLQRVVSSGGDASGTAPAPSGQAVSPTTSSVAAFAAQLNDKEICVAALTRDRNAWETAPAFAAYKQEVDRRGFDLARCRSLAGSAAPAVSERSSPPPPSRDENHARALRDFEVCRAALLADRSNWDPLPQYAAYRREAERRGLNLARCSTLAR